jgi:uncharacterized DUF497 family protein
VGRAVYKQVPFEWDDAKKDANPTKHEGVTFEEAFEAFFDPGARLVDAGRRGEERDALIGYGAESRILYLVHVEILEGGFRLISARKATREERALYEDGS